MNFNNYFAEKIFDLPKGKSNIIKVIGVGGGGCNAVNRMFSEGIKGVDYIICNTDAQALENSKVPHKIQLGINLTEGLGAGANPEVGERAAQESLEEIRKVLEGNTQMVFITAGMGGGTGTGASPVIAKLAKDMGILTVGIVTYPFASEGPKRRKQAESGIKKLRESVDSLIVINNNKLTEIYGDLGIKEGYGKADETLMKGAKGMAEVISNHYVQNIDLRDARTVLENGGTAIMGAAIAEGENRALDAITGALNSPLLNDNKITGAKNALLLIVFGKKEASVREVEIISNYIQAQAGDDMTDIIMGIGEDETLGEALSVTVIATGFDADQQQEIINGEVRKVIHVLDDNQPIMHDLTEQTKPVVNQPVMWETKTPTPTPPAPAISIPEPPKNTISISDLFNIWVDYEVVPAPEKAFRIIEQPQPSAQQLVKENAVNQQVSNAPQPFLKEKPVVMELNENPKAKFAYLKETMQPNEKGEIRHNLNDYMGMEEAPQIMVEDFDRSNEITVFTSNEYEGSHFEGQQMSMFEQDDRPIHIDPINSRISDVMAKRSNRLQDYNHKFKPANYTENGHSRTSVSKDSSGAFQIRKNNSYLHDNVD